MKLRPSPPSLSQVLANQLPTIGGVLFFGRRFEVLCVWVVLRLKQTYEVHSGYDFSGTWLASVGLLTPDHAHHDHHHTANMGNFGNVYTDWLFGTMDHYVRDGMGEGYVAKRVAAAAKAKAQ